MEQILIHDLFTSQVKANPDVVAIQEERNRYSYLELNDFIDELSKTLISIGVREEIIVCSLLPVSANMVVSMISIFRSGGIYLPVSFDFSEKRFSEIFRNTFDGILVVNEESLSEVKVLLDAHSVDINYLVILGEERKIVLQKSVQGVYSTLQTNITNSMFPVISPDAGNYIYYTSGSTGEGKPILGSHKSLSHYIRWAIRAFGCETTSKNIAHLSTSTFDASLKDCLVPLCSGGTLFIPSAETKNNIHLLLNWIDSNEINLFQTVPSLFRLMLKKLTHSTEWFKSFDNLKYIILDGEVLYAKDVNDWRSSVGSSTKLVNMYGTTESTILDTFHIIENVPSNPNEVIHVGTPIDDTFIIIANNDKLCRIGEVGEVFVKSPYLTKGYYKREDLNKASFVQNPIFKEKLDIVYKTGDRGRYRVDRSIEILGRLDNQVKVNGVRIELGEIQQAALSISGIHESIVVARKMDDGELVIACYFVSDSLTPQEVKERLSTSLNKNAVPQFVLKLAELPLNSNGKVDKAKLPKPEERVLSKKFCPPENSTEEMVAKIFEEILTIKDVSREESFFDIGGQSLKAIQLITHIHKQFNVSIKISDIFKYPTVAGISQLILSCHKSRFEKIPKASEQDHYPVSHAQRRLWILDELGGVDFSNNLSGANLLIGSLDIEVLQRSLLRIVERHEILRTSFINVMGEPRQAISKLGDLNEYLSFHDFRKIADKEEKAKELVELNRTTQFDLSKAPMVRFLLIQVEDDRHIFSYALHHIISDGWSMNILLDEAYKIYNAIKKGEPEPLPTLAIQYKDFSVWSLAQSNPEINENEREYWIKQFSTPIQRIDLPLDRSRSPSMNGRGSSIEWTFTEKLVQDLYSFSSIRNCSVFITLLAAVKALLYRYTNQNDMIIGTIVAGRDHKDLENQIGFYANLLPIRTRLKGDMSFDQFLSEVKDSSIGAFDHRGNPFDKLIEDLNIRGDLSRNPIVDVVVQYLDYNSSIALLDEGMDFRIVPLKQESTSIQFDLQFNFVESKANGFKLVLQYNAELFNESTIQRLLSHLNTLVDKVISNPTVTLESVDFISQKERQTLLLDFSGISSTSSNEKTFIDEFYKQVALTPQKVALVYGQNNYTYHEVNTLSNQLARHIQKHFSTKSDDMYAVVLERNEWVLISILAILKAGGAFLPIDSSNPQTRIDYIVKDSNCKAIIDQSEILHFLNEQGSYSKEDVQSNIKLNSLAYVIYTSGSTGYPKGVMIEHKSLTSFLICVSSKFEIDSSSSVAGITNYTFDISILELLGTLASGAQLTLFSDSDPFEILKSIKDGRIDTLQLTPSRLDQLIAATDKGILDLVNLKRLLIGGEVLREELFYLLRTNLKATKIFNCYGPTEATIWSTAMSLHENQELSIGAPLPNERIYIVDENSNLVPIGVHGEICIGGDGLARGYLNNKSLTAEKFITNPFCEGEFIYKTGDIGKWMPDGNIKILGRNDNQVKLRGYRIELNEIISALRSHDQILDAALVLQDGNQSIKMLVAYLVSQVEINYSQLRTYLIKRIPSYMVPDQFVQIEKIPLTSSGKVDKKLLAASKNQSLRSEKEIVSPVTNIEEKLLAIWMGLFPGKSISVLDDFFEIGGNSITASRLVARINSEYKQHHKLGIVFTHATIRELASQIIISPNQEFQIPQAEQRQSYSASHAQKRIWLQSQIEELSSAFNLSSAVKANGKFDVQLLEQSLRILIQRHESLRTQFGLVAEEIRQFIVESTDAKLKFSYEELTTEGNETITDLLKEESSAVFDLAEAPLIRAKVFQASDSEFFLVITMHHIISDGWSWEVAATELLIIYEALRNNNPILLKPLELQYKDYSEWQNSALHQKSLSDSKMFWHKKLNGNLSKFDFPFDFKRPEVKKHNGDRYRFELDANLSERLNLFLSTYKVTSFVFFEAIVHMTLFRFNYQHELVIGCPVANRDQILLENQIGCFLNVLPLRLILDEAKQFADHVQVLKASTLEAFEHQFYPIDLLVQDLAKIDRSRNAFFDVGLTLHNQEGIFGKQQNQLNGLIDYEFVEIPRLSSKTDLWFNVYESSKLFSCLIEYDTSLFTERTVKLLSKTLEYMIDTSLTNPNNTISEIMEKVITKSELNSDQATKSVKRKNIENLLNMKS